jgi:AcrR family transcriptional regulator
MPRQDVSHLRRQQILSAAESVFSQRGLDATRMEDIAEAARLSKGTLYLYFDTKDALIEALMQRLFAPLTQALSTLRAGQGTAPERITAYAQAVLTAFEALRPTYPVIFELFALATRQPRARSLLAAYFSEYRAALERVIHQGVADGELRVEDPAAAAISLMALIEGVVQLAILLPSEVDLRRQMMTSLPLLLEGMSAAAGAGNKRRRKSNLQKRQ